MNLDNAECCETPLEDHITCLIEYLRRPDARLTVEGKTWSACFGAGDVLNGMIADRLAASQLSSHHSRTGEIS